MIDMPFGKVCVGEAKFRPWLLRGTFVLVFAWLLLNTFGVVSIAAPIEDTPWIRNPVFADEPILGVFEAGETKEKATRLKNVHTLFRKEIRLAEKPRKAVLQITGDDHYRFTMNGKFVLQGPDPGYFFAHPYATLDVTEYLSAGENCLAAHVYYHGLTTHAFTSADNRSGLLVRLDLEMEDGSHQLVTTDSTWKCVTCDAYSHDRVFGYATQFNENLDLQKWPRGYRSVGFDDRSWRSPLVERQDHEFSSRITPLLEHSDWKPKQVIDKGKGRYLYDFGQEVVGHTRIRLNGAKGHAVTVWHGEELNDDGSVRHKMRCNCDYVDRITLSGKEDLVEQFDYRGFRYIEILNAPSRPEVWVQVRHYPMDKSRFSFHSSNPLLNDIWKICVEGLRMGCQDVYVDCATREKGQYTGDTYMTVLSHLLLTADPDLAKKALIDFHHSQRFDEGMLCVAPGGFKQELAEWSIVWPIMLAYYHDMTGDTETVAALIDAGALKKLFGYFERLENQEGLLAGVDRHKWVLVDWPSNLRGGYDYEGTKNGVNTVVNAFYYGSLKEAARVCRAVGRDGTPYAQKANRLYETFQSLLDVKTGTYRDGVGSQHHALHASAFPLHFGLVPKAQQGSVTEFLRQKRLDCGLYAAPYVLAGLYGAGEGELAYELLTCCDKHSWHEMVRSGATATMEAWAPELKWNTSYCHPACATPIWILITKTFGITPSEPGWKSVHLAPQIPSSLEQIEVRFPTVAGPISASYQKSRGLKLSIPEGMRISNESLPARVEVITEKRAN